MLTATLEKTVLMFKVIPRVALTHIDTTTKLHRPTAAVNATSTASEPVPLIRVIPAMAGVTMTATMSVILMIGNQIQNEVGKSLLKVGAGGTAIKVHSLA